MTKILSILILVIVLLSGVSANAADTVVVVVPLSTCSDGLAKCSGQCVDTRNNPNYCGNCFTQCGPGNYCNTGICVSQNGIACSNSGDCMSGFCVDGYCCNAACSSPCEACNLNSTEGTCVFIPGGTDPEDECAGSEVCSGYGSCGLPNGSACTKSSDCGYGNCVDGYCCDTSCTSTFEACTMIGLEGTCTFIPSGGDPGNECDGEAFCNGTGACVPGGPI